MMLSRIKKSFLIVNNNLILSQPFVLYLLILTMTMSAMVARIHPVALVILVISTMLLSVAFLAGWFYMDKKVIEYEKTTILERDEKAIGSISLFKEFFPGVGEYFLPILGSLLLYFVLLLLSFWIFYKLGILFFGEPSFDLVKFNEVSKSYLALKTYLNSLPSAQTIMLLEWILYISVFSVLFQFATMWWFPALYFDSKNPFKAFVAAMKFFVKNFVPSMGIFLFLTLFNFLVSIFNSFAGNNIIFLFISFILFFYYATYYIVLIFLYYGEEKGYYSDSRSDSDGQEQSGDDVSEES